MPLEDRPNPSIYVLQVPDPAKVATVANMLIGALSGEGGSPLSALGQGRYILARAAAKLLERSHPGVALQLWLANLSTDIALVRRLPADQVVAAYGARDPTDSGYSPTAVTLNPGNITQLPWHFRKINVPGAWSVLEKEAPGGLKHVKLAQLDTGITRHPCFGPWTNDDNAAVRTDLGVNYKETGQRPFDPFEREYLGFPGHGTRVASVMAANDPKAFLGVARGVELVPYRVTNTVVINFAGNVTPLADALLHVVENSGCPVVNISLGDPCLPGRRNGGAIDTAYERGVIVIAAAGNVTSEVTYPGRHSRVITAGGVTEDFAPWSGGARGPRVDICAPADGITRATWKKVNGSWLPIYSGDGDGTSFAAAHVSGIACLWLARWGEEIRGRYGRTWRVVEAFRKVLTETCMRPQNWDTGLFGAGIVDAEAVLKAKLPDVDTLRPDENTAADDLA